MTERPSETKWTMTRPADAWTEALPLGNGRLGAMVFGGVDNETVTLNHDTFWSGYPDSWRDNPHYAGRMNPDPSKLQAAFDATLNQDWSAAERILQDHFTGPYTESYLPLGALEIAVDHHDASEVSDYVRTLDYATATLTQTYTCGGYHYTRTSFVSHPAEALVMRFVTDCPEGISVVVRSTSQIKEAAPHPRDLDAVGGVEVPHTLFTVQAPAYALPNYVGGYEPAIGYAEDPARGGMSAGFAVALIDAATGQAPVVDGSTISLHHSQEIVLVLTAETSFAGYDKHPWRDGKAVVAPLLAALDQAAGMPYDALYQAHVADYTALFNRVRWSMEVDLCDVGQLFNFSRYLMIAGSHPGTEATNLQGIWNNELRAPWSSNYTININTEMNYWGTLPLNLTECHQVLLDKLPGLADTGATVAETYYGAPGSVAHHNTDIWNHAYPVGSLQPNSVIWAFWPLGLVWLSNHYYNHYVYTLDEQFLTETALPTWIQATRFCLALLLEDQDGALVMGPATSPEHGFIDATGQPQVVDVTSTMTQAMLIELFRNTADALATKTKRASLSDEERSIQATLEAVRPRLRALQIDSHGRLNEWHHEAPDLEPQHRHVSHLYALHPSNLINRHTTPELAEAACETLRERGDDGTGWSLGWKILFHARLGNPETCETLVKKQLRPVDPNGGWQRGGSYPNLFSAHPPFQIDGNYASGAGIAAMFIDGDIVRDASDETPQIMLDVLPALPASWGSGKIEGLRAPGNMVASIEYSSGKLNTLILKNLNMSPITLTLYYNGRVINTTLTDTMTLSPDDWA